VVLTQATEFERHRIENYSLLAGAFYKRMQAILKWNNFDEIIMIFEDSERTNEMNADYFSRYKFIRKGENKDPTEIPCQRYIMSKRENESGLEVADFIAHTAGASVNSRLKNPYEGEYKRKDFKSVFNPPDKRLVSFIELLKVDLNSSTQVVSG